MILVWIIIIAIVIGWIFMVFMSFPFWVNESCSECACLGSCSKDNEFCPEPYFKAIFAPFTLSWFFLWRYVFKPSTNFISRWQKKRLEKYGIKREGKKQTREERLKEQIVKLTIKNKSLGGRIKELNKYKREEILDLE